MVSSKSVDGSLEMARDLTRNDSRVRVIEYKDTEALGGSKNLGIDEACGRYLWFLDVDDVPSLRFLEEMVGIKEETGADLVGCNFVYSSECSPLPDYKGDFKVVRYEGVEGLKARATERFPVTSWSMLYDAEMIRSRGLRFPAGICEDILFTYGAILASKLVCYYEKPLYKYVLNPSSVTHDRRYVDRRGLAELEHYDNLENKFRELGIVDFFPYRFTLLRVRSAGHMSYRGFMRYIRSDRYLNMMSRNLSFEVAIAYVIPTIYYIAIRLFFLAFYYKPGRAFTGGFFETVCERGGGGMTSPLSILDMAEPRKFYNPEVCAREVNLVDCIDVDSVNRVLQSLEHILMATSLSKCEIRILICLSIYKGLTHNDLQNLTGMKQSAVSRSITRLTKKKLVYSRIGKKYEVGRPYQLVVSNFAVDELIDLVNEQINRYRHDMDFLMSCWKRQDMSDH